MTVAFDAASTAGGNAITSLSWTHTPSGTPTGVGFGVHRWPGGDTPSAITYGGASLSNIVDSTTDAGGDATGIWGLANPPSGAQTAVVTWGSATYVGVGVMTFTGSDTSTFSDGSNSDVSTSSVTVTGGASDDLVFDAFQSSTNPSGNADAGQTEQLASSFGGAFFVGTTKAGGASVTMSYSSGGAFRCIAAVSVKAAGGGGGTTARRLQLLGVGA